MRRIRWRWALPLTQLTLALMCHIYEPRQYRVRAELDHAVDNMRYVFQHSPAPIGRISLGINFPAMVLAYPLRNKGVAFYKFNSDYTLIWISLRDLGVFAGIVLFWYCLGWILDERAGRPALVRRSTAVIRICGWCVGVVFGLLTGIYALSLFLSEWRPERQIGMAGIAWAILLLIFCMWRSAAEFRMLAGRRLELH